MSNPGMPQAPAAPQTDSMAGPQAPDMNGLLPHMEAGLQQNAAQYGKIKEVIGKAQVIRTQLDELVKMGDMVTTEDLVHHASKLVAKGIGAAEIAGILSEAPEQGEALAGWINMKDQKLRQEEAQLQQMASLSRHNMGVSSLRLLGAHAMAQLHGFGMEPQPSTGIPGSGAGPAGGAANDLMAGGSPGSTPGASDDDTANAMGVS